MKLSKDEIIKKLVKAVKEYYLNTDKWGDQCCRHCGCSIEHDGACPVLLAEEVLRDRQKCIHVGAENECNCINGDKYQIRCTACNGSGWYDSRDDKDNAITCSYCNGTGVKK